MRDASGAINVLENRCAHRGAQFCHEQFGRTEAFVCPYHQWSYDLRGNLTGLAPRRGARPVERPNGGMPEGFALAEHGLTALAVELWNGVVFASFDRAVEPLRDYVGPEVGQYFERIFDGRELTVLGHARQRVPTNWKLLLESARDPARPGLPPSWCADFGLWRAETEPRTVLDARGRHAVLVAREAPEPGANGPADTLLTLFPSLVVERRNDALSTRHLQPRGTESFDLVWTHFGFAADDEATTSRRLHQIGLFGPVGYVLPAS